MVKPSYPRFGKPTVPQADKDAFDVHKPRLKKPPMPTPRRVI